VIDPPPSVSTNPQGSPVILLSATLRWPIAARLAMAFADLGCAVEAVCPPGHPARCTLAVRRSHNHSVFSPLLALRAAIVAAAPDLIIPCDDAAALQLHRLHVQALAAGADGEPLRALLERSLGRPDACALATARGPLLALAVASGVRVPDTAVVDTADTLERWLASHPLPAVLKIDCSWGGLGVVMLRSHEEARREFAHMAARPSLLRTAVRALLDREITPVLDALRRPQRSLTL
jgi:hypothetical protein